MKNRILITITLLIIACSPKTEQQQAEISKVPSPTLQLAWASDTLLRIPESVLYDRERAVIYVSNINIHSH